MIGFRTHFPFHDLPRVSWYPGHMAKGLREALKRVDKCDCVIEVHDARYIPFAGRNTKYNNTLGRPKLLVLNKMDLADPAQATAVVKQLQLQGEKNVVFANSKLQKHDSINKVMETVVSLTGQPSSQEDFIKLMVVGVPNVGKSSLINALRRTYLRKGKVAKVGALPATTRAVQSVIKVADDPRVYLMDTPGILMPHLSSSEVVMKLAAAGILLDQHVGEYEIADYILFLLNQRKEFGYTNMFNIPEPCDIIDEVLTYVAKRLHALEKGGSLDYLRAAKHFLKTFREGQLGRVTIDTVVQ